MRTMMESFISRSSTSSVTNTAVACNDNKSSSNIIDSNSVGTESFDYIKEPTASYCSTNDLQKIQSSVLSVEKTWVCTLCTLINPTSNLLCEVCQNPVIVFGQQGCNLPPAVQSKKLMESVNTKTQLNQPPHARTLEALASISDKVPSPLHKDFEKTKILVLDDDRFL